MALRLQDITCRDYNWNSVQGAAAYNDTLKAKKARHKALQDNDLSFDLIEELDRIREDDPGEQARVDLDRVVVLL
jgi:hypothetical protein